MGHPPPPPPPHRRLLCPPTSPILHGGCNLNGRSLPHAPLSGCSTTTNTTTHRPTLVGRFATKNAGINEPFAKTNRLPDCCCRGHPEGPFFMGLVLTRTTPTWIGRQPLMICGRTSTRHSSLSRPLAPARKRLPTANGSTTSTLFVHSSRRRPPSTSSSRARRPQMSGGGCTLPTPP